MGPSQSWQDSEELSYKQLPGISINYQWETEIKINRKSCQILKDTKTALSILNPLTAESEDEIWGKLAEAWEGCQFSLKKKKKKGKNIYLFASGLHGIFTVMGELLSSCSMQVLEHAASVVAMHDLSCSVHVGSQFLTRDQNCICCIGRQILNHWNVREVPTILTRINFPVVPGSERKVNAFPSFPNPASCEFSFRGLIIVNLFSPTDSYPPCSFLFPENLTFVFACLVYTDCLLLCKQVAQSWGFTGGDSGKELLC